MDDAYLAALASSDREPLRRINGIGLRLLQEVLSSGEAVAFLGAGVSVPLYPLWAELISELIDAAADRLNEQQVRTCRARAASAPDGVVEIVRRGLGEVAYREVLRELFRVRRDPLTQRSWPALHEVVVRCNFRGVATTNYDPGIVDARMAIRADRASATGFAVWDQEDSLGRWRTGDVFGDDELPVLYAHGYHGRPDTIVLATGDYRRAYRGPLSGVLGRLVDAGRIVWIGFSFADQRIAAILREIAEASGSQLHPGAAPRHVAIMPWDPSGPEPEDPGVLRDLAEIETGSRLVLYPAPAGDHRALRVLLEQLVDHRYPPAGLPPQGSPPAPASGRPMVAGDDGTRIRWVHGGQPPAFFAGRVEELARLDRWAGDPEVALIGVTAWGGAGKTALVTQWLTTDPQASVRGGIQGLFAWSFYEDPSGEGWAQALLDWVRDTFGGHVESGSVAQRVLAVARARPLLLVLDGLEVTQEGPAGGQFGRLLDGTVRDVLTQLCLIEHGGLVVLTSRFPFADLEQFDGTSARMLDVPPFTPGEGASLLARAGAGWLGEPERRELVSAVDGHALAVAALAGVLADRTATNDVRALLRELDQAGRTDARVARVLDFYAERLSDGDRQLVALVSLFQRPVSATIILSLGQHETLEAVLDGWTPAEVQTAVRQRLAGLLTWHPNSTVSAHPIVRDTFRRLVLTEATALLARDSSLADLPETTVESREQALRVIEIIELLLETNGWAEADELYRARLDNGHVFMNLPASRLGQRCALAFIATPDRQLACEHNLSPRRLSYHLNAAGLWSTDAGDMLIAEQYFQLGNDHLRAIGDDDNLSIGLQNLSECFVAVGNLNGARVAAAEALSLAQTDDNRREIRDSHAILGAALDRAGETASAEREFIAADEIEYADDPEDDHLYSSRGADWASFLVCTERTASARRLTERNREISSRNGWHADVAKCGTILARCDLV